MKSLVTLSLLILCAVACSKPEGNPAPQAQEAAAEKAVTELVAVNCELPEIPSEAVKVEKAVDLIPADAAGKKYLLVSSIDKVIKSQDEHKHSVTVVTKFKNNINPPASDVVAAPIPEVDNSQPAPEAPAPEAPAPEAPAPEAPAPEAPAPEAPAPEAAAASSEEETAPVASGSTNLSESLKICSQRDDSLKLTTLEYTVDNLFREISLINNVISVNIQKIEIKLDGDDKLNSTVYVIGDSIQSLETFFGEVKSPDGTINSTYEYYKLPEGRMIMMVTKKGLGEETYSYREYILN